MLKSLIILRFRALTASLLTNRRNGKKVSGAHLLLVGVAFIYVIGVYATMFYGLFTALCQPLHEAGLDAHYYGAAATMALMLGFAGSVFATQSQLYEATDNEALLSMPIPPRLILISRLISLYLTDLLFTALCMIPALIVALVQGYAGAGTVALGLVGMLILPLGSLTLSCLFGWLFAWISSKLPNRSILSVVVTLVILGGYFYLINASEQLIAWVVGHLTETAAFIDKIGWRGMRLGHALAGLDVGQFLLFLLVIAAPFAVVVAALDRSFIGIATRQRTARHRRYVRGAMNQRTPMGALLLKDLKHFASSASWMLNGGLGLIFLPVAPFMLLRRAEIFANMAKSVPALGEYMPLAMAVALCLILTIVTISAAALSIEGKYWWQMRVSPARMRDVLISKALLHFVICAPVLLISVILIWFSGVKNAAIAALTLLVPFSFLALTSLLGIALNVRFPRMDWVNEASAVKSSLSVGLYMALSMTAFIGPVLLWATLLSDRVGPVAAAAGLTALYAILSALLALWLCGRGAARAERISDA